MPSSLTVRNCDQLYVAHLNTISVCKFSKSNISSSNGSDSNIISQLSTIFKTSFSSTITDIKLNSTGTFLAVCTASTSLSQIHIIKLTQDFSSATSIRSIDINESSSNESVSVVDICWHSLACYDSYLVVLCDDYTIKCFDLLLSINYPIDTINLNLENNNVGETNFNVDEITNPIGLSFASSSPSDDPIGCLTLLVLNLEGDIYTLYPFQPSKFAIPEKFLPQWLNDSILQQRNDFPTTSYTPEFTIQLKYISAMMKQQDDCSKELRTSLSKSSSVAEIAPLQLISPLIKNELLKLQGPADLQNFPSCITDNYDLTATGFCNCKVGNLNLLWIAYSDSSLIALLYNNDSVMKLVDEEESPRNQKFDSEDGPTFVTIAYKKLIDSASSNMNYKINLIPSDVDSMFFASVEQYNDQMTDPSSSSFYKIDCFELGQWLNELQMSSDANLENKNRELQYYDISIELLEQKNFSATMKETLIDYQFKGATVVVIPEKPSSRFNKNSIHDFGLEASYIIYKVGSEIKCKKFDQLKKANKKQPKHNIPIKNNSNLSLINQLTNPSVSMVDIFNNLDVTSSPQKLKKSIITNGNNQSINCNIISDRFVQKLLQDKQISDNIMKYFQIAKSGNQSFDGEYMKKDAELWNILIISIIDKISDLFIDELHKIFEVSQNYKLRSMFYKSILESQVGIFQDKILNKIQSSQLKTETLENFNTRFNAIKQRNLVLEKKLTNLNSKLDILKKTKVEDSIANPFIGTGQNLPLSTQELKFVRFIRNLQITCSKTFETKLSKMSEQFEFYRLNFKKKEQEMVKERNYPEDYDESSANVDYYIAQLRKDEEFIEICKNVVKKAIEDMEFEEIVENLDSD